MENAVKLSSLREEFGRAAARPKGLRFFSELKPEAKEFAVSKERDSPERFDWDARRISNRRF